VDNPPKKIKTTNIVDTDPILRVLGLTEETLLHPGLALEEVVQEKDTFVVVPDGGRGRLDISMNNSVEDRMIH